jgi:hypothetical protein
MNYMEVDTGESFELGELKDEPDRHGHAAAVRLRRLHAFASIHLPPHWRAVARGFRQRARGADQG